MQKSLQAKTVRSPSLLPLFIEKILFKSVKSLYFDVPHSNAELTKGAVLTSRISFGDHFNIVGT